MRKDSEINGHIRNILNYLRFEFTKVEKTSQKDTYRIKGMKRVSSELNKAIQARDYQIISIERGCLSNDLTVIISHIDMGSYSQGLSDSEINQYSWSQH